jgi:hypothetical protein
MMIWQCIEGDVYFAHSHTDTDIDACSTVHGVVFSPIDMQVTKTMISPINLYNATDNLHDDRNR